MQLGLASVWHRKSKRKLSALHHSIHKFNANKTVVGVRGVDGSFKQDWPQLTGKAGATETRRLSLKAAFGSSGATCTTSPDHMKKKSKKGKKEEEENLGKQWGKNQENRKIRQL